MARDPIGPHEEREESTRVDFKAQFNPSHAQDWCEFVKDVVAMANTGGGAIVIGVNDDGTLSGSDLSAVLALDPALITDKIHKYTEQQFAGCRITKALRDGSPVAVIDVEAARMPIVFTAPGTYAVPGGNQKTAFAKGTIYFRHGAKSEPGTTEDLRLVLEREIEKVKHFWTDGFAKVVAAPVGSAVSVLPPEVKLEDSPGAKAIRLTTEESAPAFKAVQADMLYPYRQKELVTRINERLGSKLVTTHDVLCIRRTYGIDENPTFSYKSQWSPRQYSEAFVEWITVECQRDGEFFQKTREAYKHPPT